jgi:predicted extracellular nuclease
MIKAVLWTVFLFLVCEASSKYSKFISKFLLGRAMKICKRNAMIGIFAAVLVLSLAVFQPAAAAPPPIFEEDFETDGSGDLRADDKGDYDYIPTNGDELIAVTGPLDYSFGFAKIQPRDNVDIVEKVLLINEIYADPDTELGDANGDGVANYEQDEFVEIVNLTSEDLDISGWTLSDGFGLRHTFPAETIIPARCSIVVFGGGTPTGDFGNAVVQTASEGALGLNNSGDTVTISDGTYVHAAVNYGGEGGDNQSLTRDPDVTGDFVKHSTATGSGGALFSPGTKIDGSRHLGCNTGEFGICGGSATFIHDVQGDGLVSPIDGMPSVVVEAVVVGDFQEPDELRGFYLQEENSDTDTNMATSEGIFVYEYTASLNVNLGDLVRLQGTVDEYYEVTEIKNLTHITVCTGISDTAVSAAVLDLPVLDYDDFESYEGMKTYIPETLWVSQNYFQGRYGQVTLSSNGRLYQPTQIYAPDSAEMWDLVDENQRRMIILDDGTTRQNPNPIPYIGLDDTLRAGDTTAHIVGLMDYGPITSDTSVRHYRIQPLSEVSFYRINNRDQEPDKENEVLRVASFNVLNLFNGDGLGGGFPTSRGADTVEEYTRQLTKIVDAMDRINAEVFGLMEIENDATPNSAIEDLVAALNAVSPDRTYDFIDTGVIGTDEIKVALIYQAEWVTPIGAFTILDSSVDPTFLDTKNRPVLAQTFMDNRSGGSFAVAVNHLKSKGSDCDDVGDPDTGDGQGNCNLTRTSAAIAEANWLATNPTGYGDGDYLIIGDLNAYAMEDPVTSLLNLGYTNLQADYIGPYAYSYIFDGGSGTLDHALAILTMSWQVLDVSTWHINTDEPSVIDYNLEFKPQDLYRPDPFRSSDHDPVLIDLFLRLDAYEVYIPMVIK